MHSKEEPDGIKMFRVCGSVCKELYNLNPITLLDSASTGGNNEVKSIARLEKLKTDRIESKGRIARNEKNVCLQILTNNSTRTDLLNLLMQDKSSDMSVLNFQYTLGMMTKEDACNY